MKRPWKIGVKLFKPRPIEKADKPVQLTEQEGNNSADWINPPANLDGLAQMVNTSTILPQCIRAYKNNIAGFGIGVRYIEDEEETPEKEEEYTKAEELIELLNLEQDTKEVFEDLIEARETYGIAYLEVIRDMAGNVVQIEFVKETPSIQKTIPLDPYMTTTYYHKGKAVERKKRYCKYKQMIGGKTVYFKEFGDPRIMDLRTGEYLKKGEEIPVEWQANEIMEFALGTEPYGTVRWIGQCLSVDGSRRAESLNNNYFINGRHTPLMIMVKGGTLSEESYTQLQEYIDDIKGEKGQHAFLLLETEATDGRTDFDQQNRPEVEIKELASILQQDELFGDYLESNRKKVQSAFQLPDLYVAYTTDFNRATAQTAQEITEKQVFQPERKSLAWVINNKLLNGYNFQHVEAYFLEPDISNPDDMFRILTAANYAGGVTPNFAKQIMYEMHGEVAENYPEEWGDIPLTIYQMQQGQQQSEAPGGAEPDAGEMEAGQLDAEPEQIEDNPDEAQDTTGQRLEALDEKISQQLEEQITKAIEHNDDEIVAVLKEVRKQLVKLNEKNVEKGWITTEDGEHIFISGGNAYGGSDGYVRSKEEEAGAKSRKQWAEETGGKDVYGDAYSKFPESIAGVGKVTEMSFEEADEGKGNPHYLESKKYQVNCQTCVVAYEARRRGYDVEAKAFITDAQQDLAEDSKLMWIDPDTKTMPEFEDRPSGQMNKNSYYNYLEDKVKEGQRYTLEFGWKNSEAGHIVTMERNSEGKVQLFDPQSNRKVTGQDLKDYLGNIRLNDSRATGWPGAQLLRVDNLAFNEEMVNEVLIPASSKR